MYFPDGFGFMTWLNSRRFHCLENNFWAWMWSPQERQVQQSIQLKEEVLKVTWLSKVMWYRGDLYALELLFVVIRDCDLTCCRSKMIWSFCAEVLRQSVFAFHIEEILPISRSKHVESTHIHAYWGLRPFYRGFMPFFGHAKWLGLSWEEIFILAEGQFYGNVVRMRQLVSDCRCCTPSSPRYDVRRLIDENFRRCSASLGGFVAIRRLRGGCVREFADFL